MILADENLTVLTVLKYGATINFPSGGRLSMLKFPEDRVILATPTRGESQLFNFDKEGCYKALKHLQKNQ